MLDAARPDLISLSRKSIFLQVGHWSARRRTSARGNDFSVAQAKPSVKQFYAIPFDDEKRLELFKLLILE
jgi:hypothetical protein